MLAARAGHATDGAVNLREDADISGITPSGLYAVGSAGPEAPEYDDFTSPDVKTVFAQFGLTYYEAEVLVHEIVNLLAAAKIDAARESAERLLEDPWDQAFRETMGTLVRRAGTYLSGKDDLIDDLAQALAWRNHLAHHFWRQRSDDFMTDQGRSEMITELESVMSLRRFGVEGEPGLGEYAVDQVGSVLDFA
jgi:hypothetical protein